MTLEDQSEIKQLLERASVIAVVGHSDNPQRTSYQIGRYLREVGYKVYPVNPTIAEIDGEPVYADLAAVPEPIDIVDVFRRSEYISGVVDEAIAVGAKAIWTQLGVVDREAVRRAEDAGLDVVMDHCIMVDHRQLIG